MILKGGQRVSWPRISSQSRQRRFAWSADKCVSAFVICFEFKCLWMNKFRQLIKRTSLAFYLVFTSSNKIFPLLSITFENTQSFNIRLLIESQNFFVRFHYLHSVISYSVSILIISRKLKLCLHQQRKVVFVRCVVT